MKIRRIQIKNYKSIESLDISSFDSLNILIGKNDAGKSNILGALDILFNSNIKFYTGLELIKEDFLETIFKGDATYYLFDKNNPEIEITAYIDMSKKKLEKLGIETSEEENELVISKKITIQKNNTRITLDFLRFNKNKIIKTPDENKRFMVKKSAYSDKIEDSIGKDILEKISNEFILIPADRNIVRDPSPGSEKMKAEDYIKDSLITLANSKEEDKKKLFEQFTSFISKISPLINKVEPIIEKGIVIDLKFLNSERTNIPLSTIGGGNNELLLLLHEIILSGGKILAIEEPEIHLHPEAQRKLYRFMEEFSQTTQMIISTHAALFVQPNNLNGLFRVVKKGPKTEVFGVSKEEYLDKERLEQELNAENCEMFFADKVLLVEGISDEIMMEGLISKYCKSTDEVKVVSCYSKDNFGVYIKLLKIFKISYIVMTDLDSLKGRFQIKPIWKEIKGKQLKTRDEKIAYLKTRGIHVLSRGALEQSYPNKYRRGVSKPLDALYTLHELTREDYDSETMKDLKAVVEALEK
ncbi:MAG: AAA family ATPase [Nanoarchaeota archaeon]|nr:AAA family ATPase [Nanoarchaeota archaeon]